MFGDNLLDIRILILSIAFQLLIIMLMFDTRQIESSIDNKRAICWLRNNRTGRQTHGVVIDAVEVESKRGRRIGGLSEAHGTERFAHLDLEAAVHGQLVRTEPHVERDVGRCERLVDGLIERLASEERLVVARRDRRYAVDGLGRLRRRYHVVVLRDHFAVAVPCEHCWRVCVLRRAH